MFQRSPLVLGSLHLKYTNCLCSHLTLGRKEEYYLTESTTLLESLLCYILMALLVATIFTRGKWQSCRIICTCQFYQIALPLLRKGWYNVCKEVLSQFVKAMRVSQWNMRIFSSSDINLPSLLHSFQKQMVSGIQGARQHLMSCHGNEPLSSSWWHPKQTKKESRQGEIIKNVHSIDMKKKKTLKCDQNIYRIHSP